MIRTPVSDVTSKSSSATTTTVPLTLPNVIGKVVVGLVLSFRCTSAAQDAQRCEVMKTVHIRQVAAPPQVVGVPGGVVVTAR